MTDERLICPTCGKPVIGTAGPDEESCSPIHSPGCWRVTQVYDHDLRRWVLTEEPTGPKA